MLNKIKQKLYPLCNLCTYLVIKIAYTKEQFCINGLEAALWADWWRRNALLLCGWLFILVAGAFKEMTKTSIPVERKHNGNDICKLV